MQPAPGAEVRFVDTTLRDGQQCLWALSMRTNMMLPIVDAVDEAGFEAVEIMSAAQFKKCVRDLKEDPWERIRLVSQRMKNDAAALHQRPLPAAVPGHSRLRRGAVDRKAGGERHPADADLRFVEHGRSLAQERRGGEEGRRRHHHQPDLLAVSQAHGRILCRADAPGRGARSRRAVSEGSRRADHAGSGEDAGAGDPRQCRGSAGRVSYPLRHRVGTGLLFRSHDARDHVPQYRRSASGRCGLQSIGLQCHGECARDRDQAGRRRSVVAKDRGAFQRRGGAGRVSRSGGRSPTTTASMSIRCRAE